MGFYPSSFLKLLKRQPFFFEGFARGFKVGDLFLNSSKFLFQPFLADSCKRNKSVLAHGDLSLVHSNIEKIINRSQVTERKIRHFYFQLTDNHASRISSSNFWSI